LRIPRQLQLQAGEAIGEFLREFHVVVSTRKAARAGWAERSEAQRWPI
jgi:hypothetical protein